MTDEPPSFDRDLVRAQVRARLFGEDEETTTVGRYRVLRRIGSGAMGVVYAAHDPHLDRQVALKLAKPGASTEQHMARAVREAQALARLSHPHVVTVFDVGVHDGRLFVAMELIDGVPLSDWMRPGRPWREVLRVLRGAGQALAAAHGEGLIHRDFKPDNVLVTPDGRAKVLDFGLVRPAEVLRDTPAGESPRPLEVRLTDSLAILGTPAYMAPEQLEGRDVDPRADQYAFCAVLYEALYGYLPHPTGSISELLESVLERPPRPAPRETDVPQRVKDAIQRGLSREPDARYPSMDALLEQLDAATADTTPHRAPRRGPAVLAAVGCGALGLLGAAAAVVIWAPWDAPEEPRVQRPLVAMTSSADAGTAPAKETLAAADAGAAPDAGAPPEPEPPRPRPRPRPVVRDDPPPEPEPEPEPPPSSDDDELETGFFVRDVVRRCWRAYQEEHPDASITPVTVNLTVDAAGAVTDISADSHSEVPELLACIERRGRDWQGFPRHTRARHAQDLILLRPAR